ncbi:DUF4381 domain-containing protein [Vibrio sp. HN007]|uniref:DUF4381 domain-containing protein n=1 Tax=Vibrio iocasae TaxID=3098914 RepID=UPI0035D3DFF0
MSDSPLSNKLLFIEIIDVTSPEQVSWIPQTIGWKLLALAALGFVGYKLYKYLVYLWQNRYRSEAMEALDSIKTEQITLAIRDLNLVLKTVASYKDKSFSSVTGEEFLIKLDAFYQSESPLFHNELGLKWQRQLLLPPDQVSLQEDEVTVLLRRAKCWIAEHNPSEQGDSGEEKYV